MRLSGGEAALARWLRAAATGDPVDVRVGPLPDPDGIERREGRGRCGEWGGNVRGSGVAGLGFGRPGGYGGDRGGPAWPVGTWGGLVASWAPRPSGGGGLFCFYFFCSIFVYYSFSIFCFILVPLLF